jgi:hypothetical protein
VRLPLLAVFVVVTGMVRGAATPAAAALEFIEKVRSDKVDLSPGRDTAISTATGKDKQKTIAAQLRTLSRQLDAGPFEAGPIKEDGDLAAILVHQASGFDPARHRVLAIAVVKKDGDWLAAPVQASFENTGLGYDEDRIKRCDALEDWMMRQRPTHLAKLREETAGRLKREIASKLDKRVLHSDTPTQLTARFLEACRKRDQATALALLGGTQEELPTDWTARIQIIERAFSGSLSNPWWSLFLSDGVIRTIALEDEGPNRMGISLVCLDASMETATSTLPQNRMVKLNFKRQPDGPWRLDLPESLMAPSPSVGKGVRLVDRSTIIPETIRKLLPNLRRKQFPAASIPQVKDAVSALMAAAAAPTPEALLPLIAMDGDPSAANTGTARLVMLWRDLHSPRDVRTLLPLAFKEDGDGAVASFQLFSSREPERADLRTFYFVRGEQGWLLVSGLKPTDPPPPQLTAIKDWEDEEAPSWTRNWEQLTLSTSVKLDKLPQAEGPSEDDTRRAFETWIEAVLKGDVATAIASTAYLDWGHGEGGRSSTRLLRNLGFELTSALKSKERPTILKVIRQGQWTAISARIGKAGDADATYPLYAFVTTPVGPRLMLEIDLFANGTQTRKFLNEAVWGRLNAAGEADAVAILREMYEAHRHSAETERTNPPTR